jgi:hypothetical protein
MGEIRLLENERLIIDLDVLVFFLKTIEPLRGPIGIESDVAVPHGNIHSELLPE